MLKDLKFAYIVLQKPPLAKLIKLIRKGHTLDKVWDRSSKHDNFAVLIEAGYTANEIMPALQAHKEVTGSFENINGNFIARLAKSGKADVINALLDAYLDAEDGVKILCLDEGRKNLDDIATHLINKGEFDVLDRLLPYIPNLAVKHQGDYPILAAIKTKKLDYVLETVRRGADLDAPGILETVVKQSSVDVAKHIFGELAPQPEVIGRLISNLDGDERPEMMSFLRDQIGDENWRLHDNDEHVITRYKEDRALGYGTLEIFNFAAGDGERLTVMRNLETKQEMLSRQDFNQISDRETLRKAAQKLVELGGSLPVGALYLTDGEHKPAIRLVRKVQTP